MPLQPEAILFQHQHFLFLMRPSLKLSGLLKASVVTNVMVSRPVLTEVEPYWKSLWGGNAQHKETA